MRTAQSSDNMADSVEHAGEHYMKSWNVEPAKSSPSHFGAWPKTDSLYVRFVSKPTFGFQFRNDSSQILKVKFPLLVLLITTS